MIDKIKKLKNKEGGFTIVELLIVIVVIGILAAITIVSYTGITTQAKTAHAQQNASSVQSVADAFNAENSKYPATTADFAAVSSAKLPAGITLLISADPTASNGETSIRYQKYTDTTSSVVTGGAVTYWDFTTGATVTNSFGATTGGTLGNPAS